MKIENPTEKMYIEYISNEVKKLREGAFHGNVEFKFNLKDGNVTHINCSLNKSVRFKKGG